MDEKLSLREARLLAIKMIAEGLVQPEELAKLIHKALNQFRPDENCYCIVNEKRKEPFFLVSAPTVNIWEEW